MLKLIDHFNMKPGKKPGAYSKAIDPLLLTTLDGDLEVQGLQIGKTGKAPRRQELKASIGADCFVGIILPLWSSRMRLNKFTESAAHTHYTWCG